MLQETPHRIGLVVLPNFQSMCFAAISAFEVANKRAGQRLYDIQIVSELGGNVPNSLGIEVSTKALKQCDLDTVLVAVDIEIPSVSSGIKAYLRETAERSVRMASICLGAFALGDAGLLDGRRVTTHWRYAAELQRRFPKARVEMDKIFIRDDRIWSSAGMSAGIDLALELIETDHGRDLARLTAGGLVIPQRRAGGQSQRSALLDIDAQTDRIQTAMAYAKENLDRPLSIDDLAKAACLSLRHFSRLFRSQTGKSPAKAIEALRLEAAKYMLEETSVSIKEVSNKCGFGDPERMRRAFIREFGEVPREVRNASQP